MPEPHPHEGGPPAVAPLGLLIAVTARELARAFEGALGAARGSQSTWRVLLALRTSRAASQRELAETVGIQGATLTHHLNAMEADGLLTRRRDPENRRVHLVELTDAGDSLFFQLKDIAVEHDRRLHVGLDPSELAATRRVLQQLRSNVHTLDARPYGGVEDDQGQI